jgi:FAD/FMN-containing dehydrogenase
MSRYDIDRLKTRLAGIRFEADPTLVQMKSRDFYWYSPTLKRQLDKVCADLVVMPDSREQVLAILAACHDLDVPVTPRGSGTGNYGQAMPLSGGVILDLSALSKVLAIESGRVTTEPGAILSAIDAETKAHSCQELRMHPSTYRTASLGGFVAGGSGGIGSIRWGGLRDLGNIIRLQVATLESSPRLLDLSGEDVLKVAHAYGTNGVITQVEVPLAPAYEWTDWILGFPTLGEAARFANALGEQDGILTKNIAVIEAPVAHDIFTRYQRFLPRDTHCVIIVVATHAVDALKAFVARHRNAEILFRLDQIAEADAKGLPPAYELTWNHTTLRALRLDPSITYLQVLYPFPDQVALVETIQARFGEEVPAHLEFVRFDGKVTCFGLPLVRFTSEERLDEIMHIHEAMGAPIFNPHRYTLEEGGMKQTDALQLDFKTLADPKGLLNPGKMIAWENPDYDFRQGQRYLFRGLAARGAR